MFEIKSALFLLLFLFSFASASNGLTEEEEFQMRLRNLAHYRMFGEKQFGTREILGVSLDEENLDEILKMGFAFIHLDYSLLLDANFVDGLLDALSKLSDSFVFYLFLEKSSNSTATTGAKNLKNSIEIHKTIKPLLPFQENVRETKPRLV